MRPTGVPLGGVLCDNPGVITAVRAPLVRRPDLSPIGSGVCSGLATHLGVAAVWIRVAFVVIAVTGVGVLAYPAAWWLMPSPTGTIPARRFRARDALDFAAYGLIALGLAELLRELFGVVPWWVGLPIAASLAALVVVFAITRRYTGATAPASAGEIVDAFGTRPGRITRAATGALLVIAGAGALLGTSDGWTALRNGILALGVLFVGLMLLLAPWLYRMSTDLVEERRARVRNEERAEMAAHLHDSVLQTLAMVQRRADDPNEVVRLARRQERELRDWLLSGQRLTNDRTYLTVAAALAATVAELETEHGVPIELVQVRDCPLGEASQALLFATREAIVNAQRHSGAAVVSVYCEVDAKGVVVYVRDRGRGFDRAAVGGDRRGVRDSIEGRLERHGGIAEVRSAPGEGTEVMLRIERAASAAADGEVSL